MKAVVYDAPGSFAIRDIPTPDPKPGEVRVRVRQTGICGTDLHIHNGKFFAEFPLTPGHELVGPVFDLDETLERGQKVVDVVPNLGARDRRRAFHAFDQLLARGDGKVAERA